MSDNEVDTLFGGKKFWIAQRVPSRNHWIELLEEHGGHLVKLDTQADLLIADHARKDAPAGSLSWKFIEDSVRKGELQDPEDYPAGAVLPSDQIIPIRPSAKMSRTPYTAEDDRQLWDWVTDAESRGVSISGNKLYQELEAKNPRHTWQSWRDRWLKSLAHRERPVTATGHTSPQPNTSSRSTAPPQNGRRRAPASSSSRTNPSLAAATAPTTTEADPINDRPSLKKGRPMVLDELENEVSSPRRQSSSDSDKEMEEPSLGNSFTGDEKDLLLSMSQEIEDIDPERMMEAWDAFSEEYPQHSGEEWKNFWDEVVRPSRGRLDARNVKKSKNITRDLSKDGPDLETETSNKTQAEETARYQNLDEWELEELDPWELRKASKDLVDFLSADESPVHFTVKEEICGDWVLMYDICRAVTSAFDKNATRQRPGRWEEVAKLIGINPSPLRIAALKEKFSSVVARFFDFEKFTGDLNRGQQETEIDTGTDEEIDEVEYSDAPDSSIELPRGKEKVGKRRRSQTEDEASEKSSGYSTGLEDSVDKTPRTSKRQRIDKGKGKEPEIPSTPEALYQPLLKPNKYQNVAHDPETQDFHYSPATYDEEDLYTHSQDDSPSNQIRGEAYRATRQSSEPDRRETHRKAARGKIERYMALGYTEEVVRKALAATTSNDQNAGIVMEELTRGKGIPDNLQGVWTAADDSALKEAGGMERMIEKHGPDHVDDRVIWLEAMEEIQKGAELA